MVVAVMVVPRPRGSSDAILHRRGGGGGATGTRSVARGVKAFVREKGGGDGRTYIT